MYTSLTSPGECAPCLFTFFYHRDYSELIATMIPILQSLRLICHTFYKNLLWIFITHPWIEINGHLARQLISLTREKKRQQRTTWFGGRWLVHNYIHSADFLFVFRGSVIYPKLEEPLNDYSFTLINNFPKKITIVS